MKLYFIFSSIFLLFLSYLDIRFQKIPNKLWVIPFCSLLFIYPTMNWLSVICNSFFLLLLFMVLLFMHSNKKAPLFGGADCKLLFYFSFLFSFEEYLILLLLSALLALPFSFFAKKKGMNRFPFIPFLSISAIFLFLI